jgi:hypothetical protein
MTPSRISHLSRFATLALLIAAASFPILAQQSMTTNAVVPNLVNFSGMLTAVKGKPLTGIVGVTFHLYQDQHGGAPLWLETQYVQPDATGRYSVMLGSTSSQGLPSSLFVSGEARWLGVQAQGQEEQPRVMLLSVPYAMKAVDAQTIGGLPPSAFVLAAPATANAASVTPATSSDVTTTGGTVDKIPMFTTATKIQNSILSQTGTTAINVGGNLNLPATGRFELGSKLFAFGSYGNGNAFLGFAGNTTTTGTSNTADGTVALFSNTTGSYNTADGNAALFANTAGSDNTATGYYALALNTTGGGNAAFGYQALAFNTTNGGNAAFGYQALYSNTQGYTLDAFGYQALYSNNTGYQNDAFGKQALYSNNTGNRNAAFGDFALFSNTTGGSNTGVGDNALYTTTGSDNTCIGTFCTATGDVQNATAIGAHAVVGQSNSLVLGGTGDHAVKVGIGTTTPSNILTIGRGTGHPVSDSWETYSSRRWKTNIHPLQNALSKVEQLRGVSYDLKDSGKHEIGVIAEEVGEVVPEVVSYEKDGKDATGVDYSRLTALLIEATKEQQALIRKQQQQIRTQQAQLKAQLGKGKLQDAEIAELMSKVKAIQTSLSSNAQTGSQVRTVRAQMPMVRQ